VYSASDASSAAVPPPPTVTGHRAFFILFTPMLDSPDWPSKYEEYRGGVIVMNPFNASKEAVQKVRDDLNARVVMYFDTVNIQIKAQGRCLGSTANKICSNTATDWTRCASGAMPCCYGYNCNAYNTTTCPEDDYARALWKVYKPEWAVNQLTQGQPDTPICRYGKGPLACYSAASNAALVPFLADWLVGHGYDGVYFDQYFKGWSTKFPYPVDTDGDGTADTLAETQKQYNLYRPQFSAALRKALGPDAIMIANSGLGQVDASLNGLTIEACDNAANCMKSFSAQAAVAHKPSLSVMWLKGSDPAECANAKELRMKLPYLLEGTDFYDGTHVVCGNYSRDPVELP
jgi:hypothetical protein